MMSYPISLGVAFNLLQAFGHHTVFSCIKRKLGWVELKRLKKKNCDSS